MTRQIICRSGSVFTQDQTEPHSGKTGADETPSAADKELTVGVQHKNNVIVGISERQFASEQSMDLNFLDLCMTGPAIFIETQSEDTVLCACH